MSKTGLIFMQQFSHLSTYHLSKSKLHIIGGMLRRTRMTYLEGKRLSDLYTNVNTMGFDTPCCLRTVGQVSGMIENVGFNYVSTHDLAPYVAQSMEETLVDNGNKRQNGGYMVHVARAMLSGSASFFFLEAETETAQHDSGQQDSLSSPADSLKKNILSVQNKIRRISEVPARFDKD